MEKFFDLVAEQTPTYDLSRPLWMCYDFSQFKISGGKFDSLSTRLSIEVRIPPNQCRNGPYDSQCITTRQYDESIS